MFLAKTWEDYEVLDTGDGEKLERWGNVILRRPDPQTIWPKADPALEGLDRLYVQEVVRRLVQLNGDVLSRLVDDEEF